MKKMIIIMLVLLFVAGCTTYYRVTNLATEKDYYTTEVKYKDSGAVDIVDARSGSKIILPSSKVEQITEDEYKRGIYSGEEEKEK